MTPAIRAGKGWRGRRELAPRCSATQLGACAVRSYRQRHVRYILVRTTTTTTTTTSHVAPCVTFIFWCRVTFAMMASGQPSGAAQRRRQRRLRSWWRHEQQSIAAALAAATHHSAQQNGALRSQKTATRASEEAGSETYYAPRGPKTLPPGVRPVASTTPLSAGS